MTAESRHRLRHESTVCILAVSTSYHPALAPSALGEPPQKPAGTARGWCQVGLNSLYDRLDPRSLPDCIAARPEFEAKVQPHRVERHTLGGVGIQPARHLCQARHEMHSKS